MSRSKKDVGPFQLSPDRLTKTYTVYQLPFEVDARFRVLKVVGYGSYGQVCSAVDLRTKENVAIKKMGKVFDDLVDAKRILREVKLLRQLKHDNILCLKGLLRARDVSSFDSIYMVTDLMDADLNHIIKSKQTLLDAHCQYFICQLLRGLAHVHSADILHRDLKPSNLLVNAKCDLKICDFGLARSFQANIDLTGYVVTRWYRAPELLLMHSRYDKPIDMWSVGCILAELYARKPLVAGNDYLHQLQLVIKLLGTPFEDDMAEMSDQAKRYVASMPKTERLNLAQLLPNVNPFAIDMMNRLLTFKPGDRLSASQALEHPYLEKTHRRESTASYPPSSLAAQATEALENRETPMSEEELRALFVEEMEPSIDPGPEAEPVASEVPELQ